MNQEEEEYWREQEELRKEEIMGNLQSFRQDQHKQIDEINREILEMENDSDDEYGIY